MEDEHKTRILNNFSSLVNLTNLTILLPVLYESNVFSREMMSPFMDNSISEVERKTQLFHSIQTRGPEAFEKLISALFKTGHWDLIKALSPGHENKTSFISIKDNKPPMNNQGETSRINTNTNSANDLTDMIESIEVIKSTGFGESAELPCYSMKSKKRGVFFMINNINFENNIEEERQGAMIDTNNLEELFRQIGFHEIISHKNKTKSEMNQLLNDLAVSDTIKQTDCVFIVIASHGISAGNETSFIATDNQNISIHHILDKFNSKNCPLLRKIPKVFVFQVCRGESSDYGVKSESNSDDKTLHNYTQCDGKSENVPMRTYADMLIAHSTSPGFSSHRDTIHGSWYMTSLCKIFMKYAHKSHVEDLFKMTDSHLHEVTLKRGLMQTSSVENRGFNKHCFLNPGFFG